MFGPPLLVITRQDREKSITLRALGKREDKKMKRRPLPKRRSLVARALESPLFRMRKIKPFKGKGSYKRRPKHRDGASVFRCPEKIEHVLPQTAA